MNEEKQSYRWLLLAFLTIAASLISIARLIDLQIIQGPYYRALAQENRLRRIPIKAPRGEILDRSGEALARNLPVYRLAEFSAGGVVSETKEITREEALNIQATDPEKANRLIVDIKREYPLGRAAAHIIGYVSEASEKEVGEDKTCGGVNEYGLGDLVGRTGVEKEYECLLRGTNGEQLIEVDTRGNLIRVLGRREPVPGKTLRLSIDSSLQKKAYEALEKTPNEEGTATIKEGGGTPRGAFVAQNPETGEVLVMVSVPSFDPNEIGEQYPELEKDGNLPLFNRAVGGAYPPGSTFKIVTAAAGLQEEKIDKNWQYEDKGRIVVNDFSYSNWYFTQYGKTEGVIDIVRAIARSTDTFFYKVGELVGPDKLAKWARKFGLGQKTGIDLGGEARGLVPDPEWKEEFIGERWYLGNTYHMSIGQADLLTTPLQINQMTSVIASGGKLCQPRLASQGDALRTCQDLELKSETLQLIKEGMVEACSAGGTAFPFFQMNAQLEKEEKTLSAKDRSSSRASSEGKARGKIGRIACKTGTAQFGGSDKTHAWLTAFFTSDKQKISESLFPASHKISESLFPASHKIAATALIEEGGEGSRVAAPVVKEVLDYWLTR